MGVRGVRTGPKGRLQSRVSGLQTVEEEEGGLETNRKWKRARWFSWPPGGLHAVHQHRGPLSGEHELPCLLAI